MQFLVVLPMVFYECEEKFKRAVIIYKRYGEQNDSRGCGSSGTEGLVNGKPWYRKKPKVG